YAAGHARQGMPGEFAGRRRRDISCLAGNRGPGAPVTPVVERSRLRPGPPAGGGRDGGCGARPGPSAAPVAHRGSESGRRARHEAHVVTNFAEDVSWLRDVSPDELRRIVDALYRVHRLI